MLLNLSVRATELALVTTIRSNDSARKLLTLTHSVIHSQAKTHGAGNEHVASGIAVQVANTVAVYMFQPG